jgi:hypothetical protein
LYLSSPYIDACAFDAPDNEHIRGRPQTNSATPPATAVIFSFDGENPRRVDSLAL